VADEVRDRLTAGDRLLAQGDPRGALVEYRRVLDLAPEFALAHKRAGDCELRLGQVEAARTAYQAAVDFDANPYRELSAQNAILRQVCAERNVPVVESQVLLDAASPSGITGFDLMWDNCHPKLEGYLVLARACAETLLAGTGADGSSLRTFDRQQLERALGIDTAFVRGVLHERGKYCYAAATLTFDPRARFERARIYLDEASRLGPPDADITCSEAILAALESDAPRSLELWRRAHRLDPAVARERLSNRYVEQIMRRIGVEDLDARLRGE
jgi:tetratricopeptide (TPR) repeat protein